MLAINITLALVLSSIIGMNRGRSNKSAGLRTHMLTGTGACVFTILSMYAFPGSESARVAANIVTGIGFLGGGIIIQKKDGALDVTTAAGVWATAAIGMACGVGAWFLASYVTLAVWVTLALLKRAKVFNDAEAKPEVVPAQAHIMHPKLDTNTFLAVEQKIANG
ncbi:MAG: hypothetical protein CL607_27970 [Anaerolineaceae bacterium]|nr:hypothetical protein [Anaerolineaceae bacterium]